MGTSVTFSKLLREPKEVINELDEGDILVTRRDGDDLRISKASNAVTQNATVQALAHLITALLDDEACDRIADRLTEPFPWIVFLPAEERHDFVGEFLRLARASASVGNFARLGIALEAWKATAEAYADPGIAPDGADLEYLDAPEPVTDPRSGM